MYVHAECEWHANEMTCEDAEGDHDDHDHEDDDDHDGHDHDDEHDEHGHNEDANSFELVGLAVGSWYAMYQFSMMAMQIIHGL